MTAKEVVKFAKEQGARMVDLKFMDYPSSQPWSALRQGCNAGAHTG